MNADHKSLNDEPGNPLITPVVAEGSGSRKGKTPDAATTGNAGMPELLQRQRAESYRVAFMEEYSPVGPTEVATVNDLAHQAAEMELWWNAVGAVERQAVRGLGTFAPPGDKALEAFEDAVMAGAMSSDSVHRCDLHGLAHSRGFYRAQQKLAKIQNRRKRLESNCMVVMPPSAFGDESACEEYLANLFRNGKKRCLHCGGNEGCFIARRRCWECRRCKTQTGLRARTVMARSPIPLRQWFEAIRWLLWQPTISTSKLVKKLDIRRPTTVRSMARTIRAAMAAENCSEQLAELDSYYGRYDRAT